MIYYILVCVKKAYFRIHHSHPVDGTRGRSPPGVVSSAGGADDLAITCQAIDPSSIPFSDISVIFACLHICDFMRISHFNPIFTCMYPLSFGCPIYAHSSVLCSFINQ